MNKIPRVILLIETSHAFGRGLIRGVSKYSRLHGPWSFYRDLAFYANSKRQNGYHELKNLNADGIIIREPKNIDDLRRLNIPIIVSPNKVAPDIPAVTVDNLKVGEIAAQHMLERGFKNFAFCGYQDMPWSVERYEGFRQYLEKKGCPVLNFAQTVKQISNPYSKQCKQLGKWLDSLPKPVGMMACNDVLGCNLIETCKILQINVPEQIAIIGVDNDELLCELTDPPLTSVYLDTSKSGYEAAELLDRLMQGETMKGQTIINQPIYIADRQSTDILAIKDTTVAEAIYFIHQNFKEPIQVSDVANAVAISRRHLHKLFNDAMKCSVSKEIRRIRINYISRLLLETDLSISKMASSIKFTSIEHLSRYFRRGKGMSMQEYRNEYKLNL